MDLDLSAQHLSAVSEVGEDGVLVFVISDEEDDVEIGHEFGDPEESARRFEQLAEQARVHAERIRAESRASLAWT